MKPKLRIGIVGCGQFARHFVPIFQSHPAIEFVAVTDKFPERSKEFYDTFHTDRIYDSFEEMVRSDALNAVAIFSQRDTHGWMAIEALKSGKNVYSAVPMALGVDEIKEIVRLVKETGLTYSMGETGIYRPASIFCRQKMRTGEMGDMVYAEAQYNHDMSRLYDVFKYTEGDKWKMMAGLPPLLYPTHSTSMVLSAAGAHAVKVAGFGYTDISEPDIFGTGVNYWDNPFSNSSMLIKLSNDATIRISENRRIAWGVPETYITCFNGTKASYECSLMQHSFVTMNGTDLHYENVSELLNPFEVTQHMGEDGFMQKAVNGMWSAGYAPIQNTSRLPKEQEHIQTGHAGTHKFMVDDFCQAYMTGKLSPTNAWNAARYNLPGLIAHQSAINGGIMMEIPDLGDPEGEVLSEDRLVNECDYHDS